MQGSVLKISLRMKSFRCRNLSMYSGFCFENHSALQEFQMLEPLDVCRLGSVLKITQRLVSFRWRNLCLFAGFCFENFSALGEFPMEEPVFICRVLFWKFLCAWWVSDEGTSLCILYRVLFWKSLCTWWVSDVGSSLYLQGFVLKITCPRTRTQFHNCHWTFVITSHSVTLQYWM